MSVEMLAVLVAVIVPLVSLAAILQLRQQLGALERSRDELVELRAEGRS